jgi:hypothetical protein
MKWGSQIPRERVTESHGPLIGTTGPTRLRDSRVAAGGCDKPPVVSRLFLFDECRNCRNNRKPSGRDAPRSWCEMTAGGVGATESRRTR